MIATIKITHTIGTTIAATNDDPTAEDKVKNDANFLELIHKIYLTTISCCGWGPSTSS